jgi:hypothetical protein
VQKLFRVYKDCVVKASRDVVKNWVVIPAMVILYVGFGLIASATAPLGLAGGFIAGAAFIAGLAFYYSWVRRSIDKERLSFSNLVEFDSTLFFQVMSVAFIFWIVLDLVLGSATQGSGDSTVRWVAQLAAFVLFNALPEVLYIQRSESVEALTETFTFVRDNWIEWFLPFVVILAPPLMLLAPAEMITTLAGSRPLMPFFIILETWPFTYTPLLPGIAGSILLSIVPLILCHWYMLFRGHLFEAISRGRIR